MKRKALLIEASATPGETALPGAAKDPDVIKRFLKSQAGGEWEESEIEILRNPSCFEVKLSVKLASVADYAFVAFSGHGHHVVGKGVDETRICLRDGQMSAYELNTGSDRCTVVIDACRKVTHLVENVEKYARARAMLFSNTLVKRGYRQYFDKQLEECGTGVIYLYSCNLNEAAGENSEGGFFTLFLVDSGETWHDSQASRWNQCYTLEDSFKSAAAMTTKRQPQQHPVYDPGRRLDSFPFAVWIA